jgi:hypothetical protein
MSTVTPHTQFGPIISANQIEQGALNTLQMWLPTYLREVEYQESLAANVLESPQTYQTRNRFTSLTGEALPKIVAISPGMAGAPKKYNGGMYRAIWRLGIGVALANKDEEVANTYSKCYVAAIRDCIMQQKLANIASRLEFIDEQYSDIPVVGNRVEQYKTGAAFFTADVENIMNISVKPTVPDPPGGDYDYGEVETFDISINGKEVQ